MSKERGKNKDILSSASNNWATSLMQFLNALELLFSPLLEVARFQGRVCFFLFLINVGIYMAFFLFCICIN